MTDPFERLRGTDAPAIEPDVGALKARARRIQRRRQSVLVAGPLAIAIIAGAGIFLRAGLDDRPSDLAVDSLEAEQSQPEALFADDTAGKSADEQMSAPAPAGGEADAARSSAESNAAKDEGLVATLGADSVSVGRGSDFTLKVCNPSELTVERTFGTAQRYDFIVSRDDEVVWQWSDDRIFAQVQGTETWEPKECKQWKDTWDGMTSSGEIAPSGSYEGLGMLTADPQVITEPKEFCLDIC